MRSLWPIEREVFEITAREYPASTDVLRLQIDNVQVVRFENSAAGFFCYLKVATETPLLEEKSPLDGAYGNGLGVKHGMGFIVSSRMAAFHSSRGIAMETSPRWASTSRK
jgi:hypothetical protein